jgi:hypothetical protein
VVFAHINLNCLDGRAILPFDALLIARPNLDLTFAAAGCASPPAGVARRLRKSCPSGSALRFSLSGRLLFYGASTKEIAGRITISKRIFTIFVAQKILGLCVYTARDW